MIRFLKAWLIAILIVVVNPSLYAQEPPKIEWLKCLGGSGNENSVHTPESKSLVHTNDGGYALVGTTRSVDGDVAGVFSSPGDNIWLVKVDSIGQIQWQKCLGGIKNNWAAGIIQTTDNGFAICGSVGSNDGNVSGFHGGSTFGDDPWIVKLNSVGTIEWQKCLGGRADDYATSIIQTKSGNFLIAGYTESVDEGFLNHAVGELKGDAYIAKLDLTGNIIWQKCFGGTQYDIANCIIEAESGGYIFTGTTNSFDGDVQGHHGDSTKIKNDAWVVKLDTNGILTWQKCLGGTGAETALSMVQTCDSGYVVCAGTSSTDGDVSGLHGDTTTGNRKGDLWIIKLNSVGSIDWQKCIGGSSNEQGNTIILTSDCGFAIAGSTSSNDGDVYGNHGGGDAWLVKINASGKLEWQKCIGGTRYDLAYSVVQTSDGGYLLDGRTNSTNDGDIIGIHIGGDSVNRTNDVLLVKLIRASSVSSTTNPFIGPDNFFLIYPNPSYDQVHLQILEPQVIQSVRLFDIMGREFAPHFELEGNTAMVNVRSLNQGIYIARVTFSYNDYIGTFTLPLIIQH
ncbi:MAG: T9SS type A sorting domain-containing protein [bacterium]